MSSRSVLIFLVAVVAGGAVGGILGYLFDLPGIVTGVISGVLAVAAASVGTGRPTAGHEGAHHCADSARVAPTRQVTTEPLPALECQPA